MGDWVIAYVVPFERHARAYAEKIVVPEAYAEPARLGQSWRSRRLRHPAAWMTTEPTHRLHPTNDGDVGTPKEGRTDVTA
ncbi:MAG TPA: hypothetical protein VHU90_03755 [Galbitalea sp.]|nr:hypothetical protein [Galbitalea sp.]